MRRHSYRHYRMCIQSHITVQSEIFYLSSLLCCTVTFTALLFVFSYTDTIQVKYKIMYENINPNATQNP